jgi:hypothetical protein
MNELIWQCFIDFDYIGGWSYDFTDAYDEVSDFVQSIQFTIGGKDDKGLTAAVGNLSIQLVNDDKRFSPANAGSPYYGKLKPGAPVKVLVSDGINTWDKFLGYVRDITAEGGVSGANTNRVTILRCEDIVGYLSTSNVSLPLLENVTGDVIIKAAINQALRAPQATLDITFTAQPGNGDTLTIDGKVITFKNGLSGGTNECLIGSTLNDTCANLIALINQLRGAGTQYNGNNPITAVSAEIV